VAKLVEVAGAGLFTDDEDIESDCLWTISYVADTHDDGIIDLIAQPSNLSRICNLLEAKDVHLFIPAMRAIGNILSTNDPKIVERCLWEGVLDKMHSILLSTSTNVIKECLWAFSNITAGPQIHVEKVLGSASLDRILYLTKSPNIDLRKESLWVFTNGITGCDMMVRKRFLEKYGDELIVSLLQGLYLQDVRLLSNLMEAIEALLQLDEFFDWKKTDNSIAYMIEKNSGLDALEELQKHPNKQIYDQAVALLTNYFDLDNNSMQDTSGPRTAMTGGFNI
jgi:hypothetical protein